LALSVPRPKLRSRREGAAVQLDSTDKRLMNLLQSSFPLVPEPYSEIAAQAALEPEEVKARTQRLLDQRIVREITPIFDTRALGYSSMLVAARVDPEHPQRAARIINEHPGVSHNYLRTHRFNLWFTIATPPDSTLGLEGTLDVLRQLAGAESIRQLPTLTLFKINMNLEMEGGTEELAAAAGVQPAQLTRAFRAHYGEGIGEYARRLRLEWAAESLVRTDVGLALLAAEAGFADQSHFTRAFRRLYGLAPGRYRTAHR